MVNFKSLQEPILNVLLLFFFFLPYAFSEETLNVAPQSEIISKPFIGGTTKYLVDGVTKPGVDENTQMLMAPLPIRIGNPILARYEFKLPYESKLSHVRVYQLTPKGGRRAAKSFIISIDTNNDGLCDKKIVNEDDGQTDLWQKYYFSSHPKTRKVCYQAIKLQDKQGPNYGGPVLSELEIYVIKDAEILDGNRTSLEHHNISLLLEESLHSSRSIESLLNEPAERIIDKTINRGVFASMWFYWNPDVGYESKYVNKKVAQLSKLGATHLWLYPHAYTNKSNLSQDWTVPTDDLSKYFSEKVRSKSKQEKIMSFPNDLLPASKINILENVTRQLHESNIKIIINESMLPIDSTGWTFPRVADAKNFPSLCSKYVREESRSYYRSIVDSGVDGIVMGGDEFFLYDNGGDDKYFPEICKVNGKVSKRCLPTCSKLFEIETGENVPVDTRTYSKQVAKWKLFRYKMVAKWFLEYKTLFTKSGRNLTATTLLEPGQNKRTDYGIAYDVIGGNESVDVMSSDPYWSNDNYLGHYYFANEVKKLSGAASNKKAEVTLQTTPNFTQEGYINPLMLVGPAFSSIMHGATGINFYRQDHLFTPQINNNGILVSKVFRLIKYIEQLGFSNPQPPKDIAILYSRASEDWWKLKNRKNKNKSVEAHVTQNATMEVMFREGIDFDLFYLDESNTWEDMEEYRLIIIPFPYSISEKSYIRIKSLLAKGVKIVIFNSQGEVDELGVEYKTPKLSSLMKLHFKNIPINSSSYSEVKNEIFNVLDGMLKEPISLVKNRSRHDIECNVLKHHSKVNILVFCINWDKESYQFELGVRLPKNNYKVEKVTLDTIIPLAINGNSGIDSDKLEHFRIHIGEREFFILHIGRE